MTLYLMQHGIATSKDENSDRPLTDEGRAEVDRIGELAARTVAPVVAIWHSGKLRARQTAETLAADLEPEAGVEERAGLGPMDDPAEIEAAIAEVDGPVVLVGHLPHVSRTVSHLVVGDPDLEIVAFRNGALVRLVETDNGWRLDWILSPDAV